MAFPIDEASLRALEVKCARRDSEASRRAVKQLSEQTLARKGCFLHNAVVLHLPELVRCALEAGVSPDTRLEDSPVLVTAASSLDGGGSALIVRMLLAAGADHSLTDSVGYTALTMAAQDGWLECVQILLAAGADANIGELLGNTPLIKSISRKRVECLRALLPVSDLGIINRQGRNALHAAVCTANWEAFQLLLPLVADVDCRTALGVSVNGEAVPPSCNESSLHLACQCGQQEMAEVLL